MKTKLFLICAFVITCTLFTGCEKDETTGSTQIVLPGLNGEYDDARVTMTDYGESDVKGLYVTHLYFEMFSTKNSKMHLNISLLTFHNSKAFTPGTYTFPSTGTGTATCQIMESTNGSIGSGIGGSGRAISGKVTIAVSGSNYTITFDNTVVHFFEGDMEPLSFVYKGTVEDLGEFSGVGDATNPEYPGRSTIEETVSGTKFPYMDMRIQYAGVFDNIHRNTVSLITEVNGIYCEINLDLYSDTRDVSGTYIDIQSTGGLVAGTFTGGVSMRTADSAQNVGFENGKVTVAESGGIYTITLEDVTGVNGEMILNGTYTGICSYLYE